MKLLRLVSLAAVVMGLAFASQASAVPVYVQYTNHYYGGLQTGTNECVGPYGLQSVGGAPLNNGQEFLATCVRADITLQSPFWADFVSAQQAVAYGGQYSAANLKAAGYLLNLFGTAGNTNQDVQDAIWAIFQPNATYNSDPYFTFSPGGTQYHLKADLGTGLDPVTGFGKSLALYQAAFGVGQSTSLSSFNVLRPINKDGTPASNQPFITHATPEPCSLVLLGLGMAAVGIRRRRRKA